MTSPTLDIGDISGLSAAAVAQKMENEMLQHPQLPIVTRHYYTRQIEIPANSLLTGHLHRLPQVNEVVGDISVLTDTGVRRITGHESFVSPPGTKRVGYTHSLTVWTTTVEIADGDIEKGVEHIEDKCFVRGDAEFAAYLAEHPMLEVSDGSRQ